MTLKKIKPISNSKRNTVLIDYRKSLVPSETKAPRKLFQKLRKSVGVSTHSGRKTMWQRGGGHAKIYRVVDFKRYHNDGVEAKVSSIEYDPYRNCFISLLTYQNGNKSFILSPKGLKVGDTVVSGEKDVPIKPGNNTTLANIPLNTFIHNIESRPRGGGQFVRAAGCRGELVSFEENGKYARIKLKSKALRRFLITCRATIGEVGNDEANLVKYGKAGRRRWANKRPKVRGSAKGVYAHPHGNGENRTGIGLPYPKDRWGHHALGKKTRKRKKWSNKFMVSSKSDSKR